MVLKKKYQRGNLKPQIDGQIIQWYERKSTKYVIRGAYQETDNTIVLKKKYQRGNQKQ